MAYAAIAIPIIAAIAAAAKGASQARAKKTQAEALFPDEWGRTLSGLEARERTGTLGYTAEERGRVEADAAAARAGALADAEARHRQQTQGMALGPRDMFLQELATQQGQAEMGALQQAQFEEQGAQIEKVNRQRMMELQQRQASAEAGVKAARQEMWGSLLGTAGQVAVGIMGARQAGDAEQTLQTAEAGSPEAVDAQRRLATAQMSMSMVGAYGGTPPPYTPPTGAPAAAPAAAPATGQDQLIIPGNGQQVYTAPAAAPATGQAPPPGARYDPMTGVPLDAYGRPLQQGMLPMPMPGWVQ